jgi:hypothetical protein
VIEQAFYGSWSGYEHFEILARSAGLTRQDADRISHYSDLGGSAQTDEDPHPIYCSYELDGGTWAFSRTTFLGMAKRGNDYLVHILILDPPAMEAVRGDLFLLEDRFESLKPTKGQPIPAIEIGPAAMAAAHAPCGSGRDEGFSTPLLAGILGALAAATLALPAEDGRRGAALCRSVLSVLPPNDRAQLSFCSTFAHPRGIRFRLVAYRPVDGGLIARYLAGFDPAAAVHAAGSAAAPPFRRWMEMVERGIDPLFGLSLLARPEECVGVAARFLEWLDWQGQARGPSPQTLAQREGLPLLAVVNDPRNRELSQVGLVQIDATLRDHHEQVSAILRGSGETIEGACRSLRDRDPGGAVTERLLAAAERAAADRQLEAVIAVMAIAILVARPPRLERIYGPAGGALFDGPDQTADWILELHDRSPSICLDLLTAWLGRWAEENGQQCLAASGQILRQLGRKAVPGVQGAALLMLAALETATPASDSERRTAWLLALLREVRPRAGELFPLAFAARLATNTGLLPRLAAAEIRDLAEPLAATFPQQIGEQLDWESLASPALARFLEVCSRGLEGPPGPPGWGETCERPALWELASRVALAAAVDAVDSGDTAALREVVRLLAAASRLVDGNAGPIASRAADARLGRAIELACAAKPAGVMDDVLAAATRLLAATPGAVSEAALQPCFVQAWCDAYDLSADRLLATLLRTASLGGLMASSELA